MENKVLDTDEEMKKKKKNIMKNKALTNFRMSIISFNFNLLFSSLFLYFFYFIFFEKKFKEEKRRNEK